MIIHQCDLCKKISKEYTDYILPVFQYIQIKNKNVNYMKFNTGVIKPKKIELCNECSISLANALDSYLNE